MKRAFWLGISVVFLSITGCGRNVQTGNNAPHFGPLPSDPSSIVITKYVESHSKQTHVSSYTLTGTKMNALYNSIKDDAQHVLSKNWSASCGSSPVGTVYWDYHIVIHYPDYPNRSFTQTSDGCTILKDEQTGAMVLGAIPELQPLETNTK